MAEIIDARVKQKTGVAADFAGYSLLEGEIALVRTSASGPVWNFKVGPGNFDSLDWSLQNPGAAQAVDTSFTFPTGVPGLYIPTEDGTYEGETVDLSVGYVQLIWDGSTLVKVEFPLDLSGYATTEALDGYTPIPVFQAAKPQMLPDGYEYVEIDRPDLDNEALRVVDVEGNIVMELKPHESLVNDYDRPDLFGVLVVDRFGKVISKETIQPSDGGGGDAVESDLIPWFTEFEPQSTALDAYPEDPDEAPTYDDEIALWDGIVSDVNSKVSSDYSPYATKTSIGTSSFGGYTIYRYDFIPPNPKKKVMVFAGQHGQERNVVYANRKWFEWFFNNWHKHSMTQWARFNVHFVVIPVLSPSSFNQNIYAPAEHLSKWGDRKIFETDPIPCSWTRSGTVCTISFDTADFPDTGGRLVAAEYFSYPGIAGKTWVGFLDSSSDAVLPNGEGKQIATVEDGNTITVTVVDSGPASGTVHIIVATDPNRNAPYSETTWQGITPTISNLNGYPAMSHDNKGTRPFSLAESIVFRNLLNEGGWSFIMNLHSGSGNYVLYRPQSMAAVPEPAHITFETVGAFHDGANVNYSSFSAAFETYAYEAYDVPTFTPEWLGRSAPNTAEDATDMIRYLFNLLLISSRYYK